jgi:hypothetical protein
VLLSQAQRAFLAVPSRLGFLFAPMLRPRLSRSDQNYSLSQQPPDMVHLLLAHRMVIQIGRRLRARLSRHWELQAQDSADVQERSPSSRWELDMIA